MTTIRRAAKLPLSRPQAVRPIGILLLLALALFAVVPSLARAANRDRAVVIRVDPEAGSLPAGAGVPARPVPTLGDALDLVARLRAADPGRPIMVLLSPGTYRLREAVHIGKEHGGTATAPLIIRGAPGEKTILTGSVALSPLPDPLPASIAARLPPAARTHVRLYRLPAPTLADASVGRPSLLRNRPAGVELEVYDEAGALMPARWPNEGWASVKTGSNPPSDPSFTIDGARLDRWLGEPDLWAEGFWRFNWLFESLPVRGVDVLSGRVTLATPSDEGIILPHARVRVVHALSELDEPGEWWRDRDLGLLVAWPRDEAGRLEVAVADNLLRIEAASYVRLEGLRLEHARSDAVFIHDSQDVVVRNSTIAWVAGRGVAFENALRSGIDNCRIADIGGTGVRLIGGDREKLSPSGLFVRGSQFTRYARLILTQHSGVDIDGVGVSVVGNFFHDAGAAGIGIHGNEHRIVGNELTHLLMGTTDNGAIYAGRDWTARGTVIAGNFLHDIRADPGFENKGIYLDDEASGFVIRQNLFLRTDQPVFIGGGRDNIVERNLFVSSSPAIHVDSRGETWAGNAITDPHSELRAGYAEMPVGSPVWMRHYPGLATILDDQPAVAKHNKLDGNVFVLSQPFDFSDGGRMSYQDIGGNRGPDGMRLSSGADLAALAAGARDPAAFADLVDAAGRPVDFSLGPMFRDESQPSP